MKVSIITVSYNSVAYIEQTIQSVVGQDYPNIEYMVIDGGSTDGTVAIIEKYRQHIQTFISEKDNGIYDALNKGIALATGDIIGILHSDDFYTNQTIISQVVDCFCETNTDIIYGDLMYVSRNNTDKIVRYWKAGNCNRHKLQFGWMPPHPTLFIKRNCYEQYGYFDTNFTIAADYDLILRLFWKHNLSYSYLPKVLIKMRVGGKSNRNLKNIFRKSKEDYRALQHNGVGGIISLIFKNLRKVHQFLK